MKTLILVNGAHEHRPFYAGVGRELARRGCDVHYAVDSHYTDVLHPGVDLGPNAHYFSDYLRSNSHRRTPPPELADANLNQMMFPDTDRVMYSRAFLRQGVDYDALSANLGWFFTDLFDRHGFDSIVYENVSNALSYFACAIGMKRGARYIGFAQSRMPGRLDVYDAAGAQNSQMAGVFHRLREGTLVPDAEVRRFVRDYVDNFDKKLPDYMTHAHPFSAGLAARYFKKRPLLRALRTLTYAVSHRDDFQFAYQVANPFVAFPEQFARESLRHVKVSALRKRYYQTDVDLDRPYFVYPLQFHPESSTSVDGPAFNDEWMNVSAIAQNMPFGHSLYVKDHKHAAGRQPLAFYEKAARIPNVVLVSPDYDTKRLIRHSKAVVCSTSTLGYEALVMGKVVFVLGHPFYEFFPACVRVASFDGAHAVFRRYAEHPTSAEDIDALVASYYLCTEVGRLDLLEMYDDPKTMRWIADVVERKTNEQIAERRSAVGERPATVTALES